MIRVCCLLLLVCGCAVQTEKEEEVVSEWSYPQASAEFSEKFVGVWKSDGKTIEFFSDGVFRYGDNLENSGVWKARLRLMHSWDDQLFLGNLSPSDVYIIEVISDQRLVLRSRQGEEGFSGIYERVGMVDFDDSPTGRLQRLIVENQRQAAHVEKTLEDLYVTRGRVQVAIRTATADESRQLLEIELGEVEGSIREVTERLEHLRITGVRLEFLSRRLELRSTVQGTEDIFNQLQELEIELSEGV